MVRSILTKGLGQGGPEMKNLTRIIVLSFLAVIAGPMLLSWFMIRYGGWVAALLVIAALIGVAWLGVRFARWIRSDDDGDGDDDGGRGVHIHFHNN